MGQLGPSWRQLGANVGPLRPTWATLGPIWSNFGPIWAQMKGHLQPTSGQLAANPRPSSRPKTLFSSTCPKSLSRPLRASNFRPQEAQISIENAQCFQHLGRLGADFRLWPTVATKNRLLRLHETPTKTNVGAAPWWTWGQSRPTVAAKERFPEAQADRGNTCVGRLPKPPNLGPPSSSQRSLEFLPSGAWLSIHTGMA